MTVAQLENPIKVRTVYFDYLRVFATLAVMVLHTSAQNWSKTDVNSFTWQTFNFFDSIVRWGVPVFVMISGSLFLSRDIPIKAIYKKYILRMAVSYCVWSAVYALFVEGSIIHKIRFAIKGHYHLWFIPMIIGLYMCIPFIKPIIESKTKTKYFLLLAFLFSFAVPEAFMLANHSSSDYMILGADAVKTVIGNMNMHFVLGYAAFFVLGYFLNKTDITKKQRIIIYISGLLGFAFTVLISLFVSLKAQKSISEFYGNFTVNVLLEAIAVFTFFKYKKYNHEKLNAFIKKLSKYSFGAYLIHALIIELLNKYLGLNTLSFNPVVSIALIVLITCIISFTVSAILNNVPLIKKYIV